MARKSIPIDTLKQLFALSGNECAYPSCNHPIFNDDGTYIAQLCHIKAVSSGGERYDQVQTDDERNKIDNLMFMCHRHHKETDDVSKYSVEKLKHIKSMHESSFTESGKELTKKMTEQIQSERKCYWNRISEKEYELEDLKIKRDADLNICELFQELKKHIASIESLLNDLKQSDSDTQLEKDMQTYVSLSNIKTINSSVNYYENPFINRNWELHNLATPNITAHTKLCLLQLNLKVFELFLDKEPTNQEYKTIVKELQKEYEQQYDNSYYSD